ncbi:S41 family peptidase [Commensalibacter papalotli (ex Botero et al. 2024)]|uniref:Tricorn protease homolog n=1 Tax=Commensalibacter papalotli (ex Botero et al. 2024) TaxID=2972766 RepID=A0ABM9HRI9_9PROT|nr:S41 family peptidase [Commensalibacter papalotli (ex Botero et al. 2024)]CAI3943095.1 C-terminal processing protease CtpA/Prc [Commensalibacter papalotli (ex Botero et al. 2024)]CAI3947839.1 C-terminal processing protease CtpA/Prc [Commensalibacter papalotli (ex Botero et al. 2024)]
MVRISRWKTLLLSTMLAQVGAIGYGMIFMPVLAEEESKTAQEAVKEPVKEQALMRYPTLHGDKIAFVARGNVWEVPKAGGVARRLTADTGEDLMPRFSPDGKWLAFTASYQGNRDVYLIPAAGGAVKRLTYHSDVVASAPERWGPDNMVVTWTPDSKEIVFLSRRNAWNSWMSLPFTVSIDGGLPKQLPLDRSGFISYGPSGKDIAYTRIYRDFRTWKRYDGGLAQDVYTYNFDTKKLDQITHWKGTDTIPMWYQNKIYFLSDRDSNRRLNLWVYDKATGQQKQVTHFTDYDIDFPSLGDNGIVFQQGGKLYVLDLPSEQLHTVAVKVPDDGTRTMPRFVDVSDSIRKIDAAQQPDYSISPNGKRAAFAARGNIFTVPVEHGAIRNLIYSSDVDADHPVWSPDGQWIAYTTDKNGEQNIAIRPSVGGEEKILTDFKTGYYYAPRFSPDGTKLAFSDGNHNLWLVNNDGSDLKKIAVDRNAEIHDFNFSPDGKWVVYSLTQLNQQRALWVYNIEKKMPSRLTLGQNNDYLPVFSSDGKYLYFVSNRYENTVFADNEMNALTVKSAGIYIATLSLETPSPFAARSDEGQIVKETKEQAGNDNKKDAVLSIKIETKGFEDRIAPVPMTGGEITDMQAVGDKIYYLLSPPQTMSGEFSGEKPELHVYDLKERKDTVIEKGIDNYSLSYDGKKVLYNQKDSWIIADAKEKHADDKTLDVSSMRMRIEPSKEWKEMFENAWRLQRDLFVNPKMNGQDWQAVHDKYAALIPLAGSRADVNYIIGQMVGEIGNSHTYVGGGDQQDPVKAVPTALLGVDFAYDAQKERFALAKIYQGDNSRKQYRSPLTEPGLNIHEGDYLLSVNGQEVKGSVNPYQFFVGVSNPVQLSFEDKDSGKVKTVEVNTLKNELSLKERAWVEHNRELVDRLSGGKIAYIYLSDMEELGMQQFIRQFYSQLDKEAVIIDDRWNGGGFIDQILLERLRRILVGMTTNRENMQATLPQQLIHGPKVTLINQYSASDGDIFPYYFRKYGLGKVIGKRTWGGVRGIRGYWPLRDGGYITIPEESLYGLNSEWIIENHGVEPDIEVENTPGELQEGKDRQLETAVNYLLKELKDHPVSLPNPPSWDTAYPPQGEPFAKDHPSKN